MKLTMKKLISLTFCGLFAIQAHASIDEGSARSVAQELQLGLSAAGAVIGDLQNDINSGKVDKNAVSPDAIAAAVSKRYEKLANRPYDTSGSDAASNARKVLLSSIRDTMGKFQGQIVKGGEDVFVPAFFRAQVLKRFNASPLAEEIRVYATNRDDQLINADWSVKSQMKGSPLAADVEALMKTGSLEPVQKRQGDRYLGYWPMKLGGACVSCHARNGLKQAEGGFGGALVVDIRVK